MIRDTLRVTIFALDLLWSESIHSLLLSGHITEVVIGQNAIAANLCTLRHEDMIDAVCERLGLRRDIEAAKERGLNMHVVMRGTE